MLRKILHITIYLLIVGGIISLFGFAAKHQQHTPGSLVSIKVNSKSNNFFIMNEEIRSKIIERFDTLEGRTVNSDLMIELHKLTRSIPYVAQANVYRTLQGKIGIEVTLRDPLVRVVNRQNESFYIDKNGYMFPLSDTHTARVMIASGHINTPFAAEKHVADTGSDKNADDCLKEFFELVRFIDSDPFWRAMIDHVYITEDGKFELTPRNAVHIIQFGKADHIEHKFSKLKLFYTGNLAQKGWYYYRIINLEFNNQVICSK